MTFPLTVADTAAALRDGSLSCVELVQEGIVRADALDEQLGVYITRFDEHALEAAARADAELAAGIDRGPLHGIPLGIKDILAASEGPTTGQSLVLARDWGENRDAISIERLKQAGAILAGKVTTMECASGMPDVEKPYPLPRNPWDPDHWTGGSSSGTGAGVAAGLFLAGLGTDTAGSIRMPAIFCGVSGLVPTFGRVPNAGCVPLGYSLDHIGPLARTAEDCWTVVAAMAGGDARDPYAVDRAMPDAPAFNGSLHGMRIGVERAHHFGQDGEDPAVEPAFDAALKELSGLGATLVEVELPIHGELMVAAMITCMAESLAYHQPDVISRLPEYVRSNRASYPLGSLFSAADYVQAQRVRRVAQRHLAAIFADVDAIAMPAATRVAPSYDSVLTGSSMQALAGVHTFYWDAVGNPVLVVPMGFNDEGLPLSLQIAGRPFAEDTIVQIGDAYQKSTDWHLQVPPLAAAAASR